MTPSVPVGAAAFALLLLLPAAACSPRTQDGSRPRSDRSELPAEPPYIVGTITDLDPGELRIEEVPGDSAGSAKVVARLTDATQIQGAATLRLGQRVEVWLTGPVMESYPVQGTAARLVVVEDSAGTH
jgi:hypothetical protein